MNRKKPVFGVGVIAVVTAALLIVRFTATLKYEQTTVGKYLGYSVKSLIDNKTSYVGNNGKVVALIDAMPLPEGIARSVVELQTASSSPYGITINFTMKDSSGVKVGGAICGDAFYRNSIILFSLIDNVDVISCNIVDKTGKYDGASYTFSYTREAAEGLIGEDMRNYAVSADILKTLIDKVNNTPIGVESENS